MLISLGVIIATLVGGYILFVSFYPSFGGEVSAEDRKRYSKSENYNKGVFINTKNVPENLSLMETLALARKFFFTKVPNGTPTKNLEVREIDSLNIADFNSGTRFIWFGHSSFLLQMNGTTILIDPMFGKVPAPHDWLGANRFNKEMPIEIEKLPKIDAVLLSHDHYDHLDYKTILKLKSKVNLFYTPLGVGAHLKAWGVEESRIIEMDWWEETSFQQLQFICTPAQHFSGRKFSNRQSTLWSSWVIKSSGESIFFSGDSGYTPHFKEIGEKYGPFDFAMIECGQYNTMWPDIHMFPEETAQAGVDLKAKLVMPIHWGAFKLALHSWTDPIERFILKARELNIRWISPQIGESYPLPIAEEKNINWWEID